MNGTGSLMAWVVHVEGPMERGGALRREIAIKRDGAFKSRLKFADGGR